jgi:hypothetical protein
MRKIFIWALMATLLMAGSVFAQSSRRLTAAPDATFAFGVGGAAIGPSTTNNDDSCDIGVAPAATLLLPYFEVDTAASSAAVANTTLFTITNVSEYPQIAHVTVWTDLSVPVLDFNIFLTGYDVQAINLYDVIVRGIIAPTSPTTGGTSSSTALGTGPGGIVISQPNTSNPNFRRDAAGGLAINCGTLPGNIPTNILADLQVALTAGAGQTLTCAGSRVGLNHPGRAIGYVTVDVANNCSQSLPVSPTYFSTEILFDNVLIGDYQQVNPNPATAGFGAGNYAQGNPMVHIRAIPEGGPAGATPTPATASDTNLPYTFYSRWLATVGATPAARPGVDRRQPLPATFAARYIQGGTGAFNTDYKIFREGVTTSATVCSAFSTAVGPNTANNNLGIAEIVRFDERENFTTFSAGVIISPAVPTTITLPEASRNNTTSGIFPPLSFASGDVAGWMYLNLDNGAVYPATAASPVGAFRNAGAGPVAAAGFGAVVGDRASQNWVVVSLFAEGRYGVDFDAAWLGNGCSPTVGLSDANGGGTAIGPVGGVFVCPPGFTGCTSTGGVYTNTLNTPPTTGTLGTNTTP